ncbi:MAG: hypothetical protein J5843_02945 [Clostridia bacterium]|nr:hypothetical protein [Clostridia bacterium]
MPNHVINELRIECTPPRLEEILQTVQADPDPGDARTGYGTVDFNKLIPMPEELNIEASSRTFHAMEVYLTALNPHADWFGDREEKLSEKDFEELLRKTNGDRLFTTHKGDLPATALEETAPGWTTEEMLALGRQAVGNLLKYGASTWYEWRTDPDNWNTKWNAYDCRYEGDGVLRFETAWTAPHPVIRALAERFPDASFTHAWADEDIGYNCGRCRYAGGRLTEEYEPENREEATRFGEDLWEETGDETVFLSDPKISM